MERGETVSSRRARILPPSSGSAIPPRHVHCQALAVPIAGNLRLCTCAWKVAWEGFGSQCRIVFGNPVELGFRRTSPPPLPALGSTGPQCATKRLNFSQYICACLRVSFFTFKSFLFIFISLFLCTSMVNSINMCMFLFSIPSYLFTLVTLVESSSTPSTPSEPTPPVVVDEGPLLPWISPRDVWRRKAQ
jgi:hypothetical protein